jgi:hypothetical protein
VKSTVATPQKTPMAPTSIAPEAVDKTGTGSSLNPYVISVGRSRTVRVGFELFRF